jgi:dTDP-4-dehydrorhamnose 3,5-epimerase
MGDVIVLGSNIEGLSVRKLKQIKDDNGMVMHMLKNRSDKLSNIKEVYFSLTYVNQVKAWKRHQKMSQQITVPMGEIKLVVYDDRVNSKTKGVVQELRVGIEHYDLIKIPPMVWYGFHCVSSTDALIVNCPDLEHDPEEVDRLSSGDSYIPYEW